MSRYCSLNAQDMTLCAEPPRRKRGASWGFSPIKRKNTDDTKLIPCLFVLDFIEMGGFSLHDPHSYQVKWKQGKNKGKSWKIAPAVGLIYVDYYVQLHMNVEQKIATETFVDKKLTVQLKQELQNPKKKILLSSVELNLCHHLTFGSSSPSRVRVDLGFIHGRQIEMIMEITTMLELSRSDVDVKRVIEQRRPFPIQLSQKQLEKRIEEFTLFDSESESDDLCEEEFYFRHGSFPQLFEALGDTIEEQNIKRKNSYNYNEYDMKRFQLNCLEEEISFLEAQLENAQRKLLDFDKYLIHRYSISLLESEIENRRNVEALEKAVALLAERDKYIEGLDKNSFPGFESCHCIMYIILGIVIGIMGMIELQIRSRYS